MGRALVNAPSCGQRVDDEEAAPTQLVGTSHPSLPLEAGALVDDFTPDTIAVDPEA
jgi:hypothetical protein